MRWGALLLPPLLVSVLLFAVPQAVFLRASLFADLGLGRVGSRPELTNYVQVFSDSFYLGSLWLTTYVSLMVVVLALLFGFPVAYTLARMQSRWGQVLLAAIVISSFVTVVIKVLGLLIIFGTNGVINGLLSAFGFIDRPIQMLGNRMGVVIGLLHYTLAFNVLVLFSIIQTIPRSLEEAAQIHGASRPAVFLRVVLPLSLPGLAAAGLMTFNMCTGAFTSAALLGGGKVLTLPVLIQRTIVLELRPGMGAALAAVLMVAVFVTTLSSMAVISRMRQALRRAP